MQVVEWTPAMSVGSEILDDHHKMIVDCLKRLGPLIADTTGREDEIKAVLSKLEEFVLVHFSEEEQQFRAAGYPDWRAHKDLHDRMYDVVFGLKSDVEHGRLPEAAKLHELLYDWLIKHIMGEDRKYMPYLANPDLQAKQVWHRANGRPY